MVRLNDDLETSLTVTLREFFVGFHKSILLPGKRNFNVSEKDFKKIGEFTEFNQMGMPNSKNPNCKGKLKVKLVVLVPELDVNQRRQIGNLI